MDFGTASVDFASSGLGVASAGMVNGVSASVQGAGMSGGSITVNLMMPDGTKFASYLLGPCLTTQRQTVRQFSTQRKAVKTRESTCIGYHRHTSYLAGKPKGGYIAELKPLSVDVEMVTGRIVRELRGNVWVLRYQYGYFTDQMRNSVLSACEKGEDRPLHVCSFPAL